ncbi:MAG: MFS transporter [Halobacteriales archaeon]
MDRNDRALTAFTMIGHAMFHTYELVIPIFVVIWLDVFSTTPAVMGTIVGVSYALTGIGAVPSGLLADRFSSKRLIIACLLGMGGAFLLVSVVPTLPLLAIGLFVWGIAASVYHPAGLALLSRGAKERGTAFAYHGAAGNVGVATGPLLAAILLIFFDWRLVAGLLVVPVVIAAVLAFRMEFDETAGSVARMTDERATAVDAGQTLHLSAVLANARCLLSGGFLFVLAIGILYGAYYRGVFTFLPDILADLPFFDPVAVLDRPIEPSQYVYSGLLILGGVGQYAGGKLVDRIPAEHALIGGYLALAVIAVIFIPSANAGLWPLLGVAGVLGFLLFMIAPINQETISKYSPADVRGLSFGLTYTAIFGIGAIGATLAGIILTRSSPLVLFLTIATVAAMAALLGVYLLRRDRRLTAEPTADA